MRNVCLRLMPVLLLMLAASVAACGGGDDKATTTPNVIGSAGASTAPSGTAPAVGENWTINGELSGTAVMTRVTCDVVAGTYQVSVSGKLQDTDFAVSSVFQKTATGALTYGVDPAVFINVTYGSGTHFYHWNDGSGAIGSGTVTVGAKGSGSLQVIVPVSLNSPGAAVTPLTIAGKWTCP